MIQPGAGEPGMTCIAVRNMKGRGNEAMRNKIDTEGNNGFEVCVKLDTDIMRKP